MVWLISFPISRPTSIFVGLLRHFNWEVCLWDSPGIEYKKLLFSLFIFAHVGQKSWDLLEILGAWELLGVLSSALFSAFPKPRTFEQVAFSLTFLLCCPKMGCMWQGKDLCFVFQPSLFSVHTGMFPSTISVCLSDLQKLHVVNKRQPQRHLLSLLESVLWGLCWVERAGGGKPSSPFTSLPALLLWHLKNVWSDWLE